MQSFKWLTDFGPGKITNTGGRLVDFSQLFFGVCPWTPWRSTLLIPCLWASWPLPCSMRCLLIWITWVILLTLGHHHWAYLGHLHHHHHHHHHLGLLLAMTTHGDQYVFTAKCQVQIAFMSPVNQRSELRKVMQTSQCKVTPQTCTQQPFFHSGIQYFFLKMCFWNISWSAQDFLRISVFIISDSQGFFYYFRISPGDIWIIFEFFWNIWQHLEKSLGYFEIFFLIYLWNETCFCEKKWDILSKTMEPFWEDNRTFWEPNWNILSNKMEHFMEHFEISFIFFFCILPFALVFALSFATWTFWEKKEHFGEKLNILRKNEHFEKNLGPTRTLGEPFVKSPTDLVPLFARLSKGHITFEKFLYQFWMGFYLHTQVPTGQQNMNTDWNQMQSDSIPRVTGDAASGTQKMMKTGCICMPLDTPSNHCKFEHMQSWRDIHSIWALWQLPINCIDN